MQVSTCDLVVVSIIDLVTDILITKGLNYHKRLSQKTILHFC